MNSNGVLDEEFMGSNQRAGNRGLEKIRKTSPSIIFPFSVSAVYCIDCGNRPINFFTVTRHRIKPLTKNIYLKQQVPPQDVCYYRFSGEKQTQQEN
jgi:hypothetical protein